MTGPGVKALVGVGEGWACKGTRSPLLGKQINTEGCWVPPAHTTPCVAATLKAASGCRDWDFTNLKLPTAFPSLCWSPGTRRQLSGNITPGRFEKPRSDREWKKTYDSVPPIGKIIDILERPLSKNLLKSHSYIDA